ncbi:hypothetical protein [Sphingobacterium chuzhouense]|uniref:Bacterial Ig-like domain (Group 2) n=1 Tax=Sphingobacterium chuzhouense TaxID=1742264 RepID=A0ABR7XXL9_9SPHI|nr:hypothetical protein [Sphingobacterium chuzhouense]MBD1423790.1 hypothetical protein [Sphingobacterium chuzhouense]
MKNRLLTLFVTMATLIGCGKNEDGPLTINQTEVKLRYDGDFTFSTNNTNNVEWSSSDEFVGIIGSDGKFEARHIGETTITGKIRGQSITAKVIVEPTVIGVIEPYIQFGKRKSDVKNFEKRQLGNEASTVLFYTETSTYTWGARYLFEDNLFTSASLLWNDSRIEEGAAFYAERYQLIGRSNNIYYYTDKTNSVVISVTSDYSLGFTATYSKNTTTN